MTTSLPPQGSFQRPAYLQTNGSNVTGSFSPSFQKTAYFSPKLQTNQYNNQQFINQPIRQQQPRNLSPNFGVQPQRIPQNFVRNPNISQIPYQNNRIPQYPHPQQAQYYNEIPNSNVYQQQSSYLPSQYQTPTFSPINVDPRLIQSQNSYQNYQGYPMQNGGYQPQNSSMYMQLIPNGIWNQRLPQKSINKKFDYDQANFDVDYRIQQNLIHCVICDQIYKISQKSQHLQRHRQKIKHIDIRPVSQSQIKKLQKYNKLVKKGLITKPIVQPEQFNIQYDPNQYILNKIDEYYDPNEPSIKQIQIQTQDPRNIGVYRQSSRPPLMNNNESFDSPRNSSNQQGANDNILSGLIGRPAVSGRYQQEAPSRITNGSQMYRQTNRQRFDRETIPKQEPTFLVQKMMNNSSESGENLNSRGTLNQSLGFQNLSNRGSNVQTYKTPSINNSNLNYDDRASSTVNQYKSPQNVVSSTYRDSQPRETVNNLTNNQNSRLYDIKQQEQLVYSNSNTPLKKQNSIKFEQVIKQALDGRSSNSASFN